MESPHPAGENCGSDAETMLDMCIVTSAWAAEDCKACWGAAGSERLLLIDKEEPFDGPRLVPREASL